MSEENELAGAPILARIDGTVAERVLEHLNGESAALAAMLDAVRGVHVAIRDLDDEALRTSLEAEARELSTTVSIQERRRELQRELAPVFRIDPQEVTMRHLLAATSGQARNSIESVRESLREMATEVDRLNRQNAAMIGQSLAIARNVVEQLTGASGVSESYNAIGSRSDAHVGPLVQWGA